MRLKLLLFLMFSISGVAWGQLTLPAGTTYTENFDGIGTALPTGWSVRTGASTSTLGTAQTLTTTATSWADTAGAFKNCAAGETPLISSSTITAQSGSTDRALAVRPSGAFGDPGAAFTLQLANTSLRTSFSLTLKHMLLDAQTRTTTFTVQYSTVAAGTSGWTDLGTYITNGSWGSTSTGVLSFGTALDNISGNVWIRIVALVGSSNTGSRDTYGIDDFVLSWTNTVVCAVPTLSATTSASPIGTTSTTLNGEVTSLGGGTTITTCGFQYATNSALTSPTSASTSGTFGVAIYNQSLTTLTENTLYYYRGYAVNNCSSPQTDYSHTSSFPTFTTLHNAPNIGSGSGATSTSIVANWTAPTGGGSAAYTYEIQVDDDSAFGSVNYTQNAIASGTLTTTATGLSFSTTYYYRVRAVNAGGNSAWSSTSVGYATLALPPEINVTGNGNSIPDGTTATSVTNHTDFGSVTTTAGTIVRTFTILNTGSAALSLTGTSPYLVIGGTHQADFTVTAIPANSIATSGSTTFQVTFNPSADGVRTASISIANNDTDENPYNFNIQGTGIGVPVITSSLTAFGNQGSSFNYTITATNAPTSYNATSLPTGLSIDTLTGIISGTPTVSGSFNVTITATNVAGTDTETLVIAISSGPCQSESFDLAATVPSGWSGTSLNDSVAGHYLSGTNCRALGNGIELISASASNPSSISFHVDASGSGGQLGTLQYRIGAGAWTTLGTFTATTAGATVAFDLTSSPNLTAQTNVSFKISSAANTIYIDDFKVFCGASCAPIVDTPTSTSINTTIATLGGNIDNEGCSDVTIRGVEWSTTSGFANGAGTIVSASGSFTTGVFTQAVTGLPSGAVIYYKAFATNGDGTGYSGQASFTTLGPEINLRGVVGSNPSIADGDTVPQGTDNTLFATIDIGSTQEKIFRVENLGTEVLNITSISMVGGTASADFVISGITLPTTIAGGASLDFSVTFSPSAGGTRNTTLTIANDDYDENPYNFVIQGTGNVVTSVDINVKGNFQSIPDNSIYPFGINDTAFGSATVGVTTVVKTFTIENLGSSNLSLTGTPIVNITGPHATSFTVTAQPSATIAGGSSSTFQVTFNPTSLGTKNATIEIINNDAGENPYNFNISGTAKGNKNIYVYGNGNDINSGATTTSLTNLTNFGPIAVTTGVKQNTFVIANLALSDRYFSNISISGTDAAMFTVVAQPIVNAISSGNSTSFTINFTPTSVGTKNALITFSSYTNSGKTVQDSSDPSTYTFAISGDGIVYTVCNIGPVQTIAQQDFEDTPATPTLGYTYTTEGVVSITGGNYNNGSGSKNGFIGAKSFQFKGIGTSNVKTTVVNMSAVDVSKYVNINLSFKTGAFRTGTTQGLDINDFIQVESSIDAGASWSTEGVLRAYNNSRWDFAANGVFNAYYTGNNNGATIDSRSGDAELANGYATYNVKNLPKSSNLLLRLTLVIDRDDEIWAIDNIKIEGQLPLTTTWNGTWSSGTPTSSTKAIFDANYTTSAANPSVKACECEININKTVIISSGYYLEDQSDLTINGALTIKNNGSLIQANDYAVNTGNIRYERTTPLVTNTDYTYWSSPVADYTLGGVSQNLTVADKYYSFNSAIDDWEQKSAATTMDPGIGYIIRGPEPTGSNPPAPDNFDAFFIGVPNNGSYPISGLVVDKSYLLGNPYPSALDADTFLDDNAGVLNGTLYFWTHNTPLDLATNISNPGLNWAYAYSFDDYAAYNITGGVGIDPGTLTESAPSDPAHSVSGNDLGKKPTGKIASGQGFFATTKASLSGSEIQFNNSMRVGVVDILKEDNSQFFKTRNPKTKTTTFEKHRIWLNLTNTQGAFKQTLVGYITDATNEYDTRFDGETFDGNEFVDFYSINQEKNLVIQGRALPFDENDQVPLGFRTTITGAFTIKIDQADGVLTNQAVFIEDKLTNTIFDLRSGPFTFNTVAGTFNDRFVLRYTNKNLGTNDLETLENQVLVSNKNKQININSKAVAIDRVMVYDLLGRQLFQKDKVNSTEFSVLNLISNSETLLVKVTLQNGEIVTRKILY